VATGGGARRRRGAHGGSEGGEEALAQSSPRGTKGEARQRRGTRSSGTQPCKAPLLHPTTPLSVVDVDGLLLALAAH
jgi:hypothetical protein